MILNWYFFSDTNATAGDIERLISKKNYALMTIHRLEDIKMFLQQVKNPVLFIRANTIYNAYDLSQEISVQHPHVYIVLIVPDTMENIKKAMHVGASDILRYSSEAEEIMDVVHHAEKYMIQRASQESSEDTKPKTKVLSICSTKGGIGRTVTAVNLASAFAKRGEKVAIIDANFQFGDVAMYFDLKPKQTIYEWVKEGYGRKEFPIENYMIKHEQSDVTILAAPPRPEFFEIITDDHIRYAIEELKKKFAVIIIDSPSYLCEVHIKCLELADDILLLTSTDIPVLRNSKLYIDMLESMQVKGKLKVILREVKAKTIELDRVETILENNIYSTIPTDEKQVSTSVNEGNPFVLTKVRSPISKELFSLTAKLSNKYEESISKPRKREKRKFFLSIQKG